MLASEFKAQPKKNFKNVYDGSTMESSQVIECDYVIVGTGAGGGVASEIFAKKGASVLILEEGPFFTKEDFDLTESKAYPWLYQEATQRQTSNKDITIFQGRCVGGSTTVNWTASFRTPNSTLQHWQDHHGLTEFTTDALDPWFQVMEERLHIQPWHVPPNANNAVLARGCEARGIPYGVIARNVKGCANLGACGLGCPIDAKQSMLVTTIPSAIASGASLIFYLRADSFEKNQDQITSLICHPIRSHYRVDRQIKLEIKAKRYILAAGAMGSPAILLRSSGCNPYGVVGKRTFLHPVCISTAKMKDPVDGSVGAPQSVYSDHFLQGIQGPIGFKLETPPLYPLLASITFPGFGEDHQNMMKDLRFYSGLIALLRDGFHPESTGGEVKLSSELEPYLNYSISPYLWEGFQRALLTMADIQFAAGAQKVIPVHEEAAPCGNMKEVRSLLEKLRWESGMLKVVSAHVMGGCSMGKDPANSVIDLHGRCHYLENLWIFDGSIFPTSLGANPQLSIFGITAKLATELAQN